MSGAWKETVCFEIIGNSPERFLNIANRRGLAVFNVNHEGGRVFAFCSDAEFRMLSDAAAKSGTNLEVISHYGLSYTLRNYRNRIGFVSGFAVFCLMLWALSFFVWSVETVNLPANLEYIGDEAFSGNLYLKNVTIPGKVASVGNHAFNGCSDFFTS